MHPLNVGSLDCII